MATTTASSSVADENGQCNRLINPDDKALNWSEMRQFINIDKIKMVTIVSFLSSIKTDNANGLADPEQLYTAGFKAIL